jgi:tetratricopeptide (TPR) repeat protein
MKRSFLIAVTLVVSLRAAWAAPAEEPEEPNRLGIALFEQARYAEAEAEHRKAVETYRSMGPDHLPLYAASMNNLAAALQAQGKTAEARKFMEDTIALEKQLGRYVDPILTHALNNLALLHHVEANLSVAASLLQRALKSTPNGGVTRAGTLHNMAAIYFDMGKRRKAEEMFQQSLAMNIASGGGDSLPPTYTYLARLAAMRGDVARAESLMQKALDIRQQLTPRHPSLAVTLGDIGELQKDTKRYDRAIENFELALDLLDSTVGKDHMYAAPILFQYGEALRLQGRYEQAIPYYDRTIAILISAFGPEHARLATVYGCAAHVLAKLKRKAIAKEYEKRAMTIVNQRVDLRQHTVDVSSFLPNK